jgi:hypothetical protein
VTLQGLCLFQSPPGVGVADSSRLSSCACSSTAPAPSVTWRSPISQEKQRVAETANMVCTWGGCLESPVRRRGPMSRSPVAALFEGVTDQAILSFLKAVLSAHASLAHSGEVWYRGQANKDRNLMPGLFRFQCGRISGRTRLSRVDPSRRLDRKAPKRMNGITCSTCSITAFPHACLTGRKVSPSQSDSRWYSRITEKPRCLGFYFGSSRLEQEDDRARWAFRNSRGQDHTLSADLSRKSRHHADRTSRGQALHLYLEQSTRGQSGRRLHNSRQ